MVPENCAQHTRNARSNAGVKSTESLPRASTSSCTTPLLSTTMPTTLRSTFRYGVLAESQQSDDFDLCVREDADRHDGTDVESCRSSRPRSDDHFVDALPDRRAALA